MRNPHPHHKLIGCALALALSSSLATAGEPVMEPAPAPPPPSESLWQWFAGASGGYLFDSETDIWTGHIGTEWTDGCISHAFYLEVGWAEWKEDGLLGLGGWQPYEPYASNGYYGNYLGYGYDIDIVPVSINYKFEGCFGDSNWGYYIGGGLGVAFIDINAGAAAYGYGGAYYDSSDTVFYGQIFGGIVWNVSENFEVFGGARWVYIDDPDDYVSGLDDGMAELGIRFNF